MSRATRLNMAFIAKGLRAQRLGKVAAPGGHFGALQLLADVGARFRVPEGGGRGTDPRWTERRLVPLSSRTLGRLEKISAQARRQDGLAVGPMQVAAVLLERMTDRLSLEEAEALVRPLRRPMPGSPGTGRRTTEHDRLRKNR